jgi:hypothetical protein
VYDRHGLIPLLVEYDDTVLLLKVLQDTGYNLDSTTSTVLFSHAQSELMVDFFVEHATELKLLPRHYTFRKPLDFPVGPELRADDLAHIRHIIKQIPGVEGVHRPNQKCNCWCFLAYASSKGFTRIVDMIKSHAAAYYEEQRQLAFFEACRGGLPGAHVTSKGRLSILKNLHDKWPELATSIRWQATPLHMATTHCGNEGVLKFLLTTRATELLEHKHEKGYTVLGSAILENRKTYVDLLLAAGADPNTTINGTPALFKALEFDLFRTLLDDPRCNPNRLVSDGTQTSLLHYVARSVQSDSQLDFTSDTLKNPTFWDNIRALFALNEESMVFKLRAASVLSGMPRSTTALERAICVRDLALVHLLVWPIKVCPHSSAARVSIRELRGDDSGYSCLAFILQLAAKDKSAEEEYESICKVLLQN